MFQHCPGSPLWWTASITTRRCSTRRRVTRSDPATATGGQVTTTTMTTTMTPSTWTDTTRRRASMRTGTGTTTGGGGQQARPGWVKSVINDKITEDKPINWSIYPILQFVLSCWFLWWPWRTIIVLLSAPHGVTIKCYWSANDLFYFFLLLDFCHTMTHFRSLMSPLMTTGGGVTSTRHQETPGTEATRCCQGRRRRTARS